MSEYIQLPFRAGIDEGTDPKQIPPGTLLIGENIRQDKFGRVRKRFGIREMGMESAEFDGDIVAERIIRGGKAVVVSDANEIAVESGGDWRRIDRMPNFASTYTPIADTTRTVSQASTLVPSITPNLRVTVYSTATTNLGVFNDGEIYVMVEDHERGVILVPPTLVNASAKYPRVFGDSSSSLVYVVYVTAAGVLTARNFNAGTGSLAAPVTLKAGVSLWDGDMLPASNTIIYACTTATGVHVERGSVTTGVMTHSVNPAPAANFAAIAVDIGPNAVTVVYSDDAPATSMVTLFVSNLTTAAAAASLVIEMASAIAVKDLGTGFALVALTTMDPTEAFLQTASYVVDQTGPSVVGTSGSEISYHLAIASRIFAVGERYFMAGTVAVLPPSMLTSLDDIVSPQSVIVVELQPGLSTPSTEPPHRRAGTLESRTGWLQFGWVTQATSDGTGIHLTVPRKQREPAFLEAIPISAVVHRLEDRGEDWGAAMTVGPSALVAASSPFWNDGASTHPLGFIHEPDILDHSVGGGGSGSMATGAYIYCCVYEWRDARGVLHRSAPGAVYTVTGVAASGSVVLKIACTSVDAKGASNGSPVRIAIYRSTVGGSTLYRHTFEPSSNVYFNDPASAYFTFTDTRSDTSITGSAPGIDLDTRPSLYTDQELAEVNPASAVTGIVHNNRAWLLSGDRRTLQFSKRIEEDVGLAAAFNEELALAFASDKYALASLDDKLVALGEHIDAVFGAGPASDGSGIDWTIQRIHADASCTSPRSLAVIPGGLIFRSPRGFEMLDRGLNVTYIGGPVEDTLVTYPNVTSAAVVANEQEVRFTCVNDDGDEGVVIVFNYGYRAWYVRKYWGEFAFDAPFVDAAYVDGVYYLLTAWGSLFEETTDSWIDDPSSGGEVFVSMRVAVPVYPTGPGGWHRLRAVQIIGESKSHHKLTIEITRDYDADGIAEQTRTFADGSTVTDIGPLEQARVDLKHQKRQAAVVTIYDESPETEDLGTGEGPILSALGVFYEPKQGPAKLPAAKRG